MVVRAVECEDGAEHAVAQGQPVGAVPRGDLVDHGVADGLEAAARVEPAVVGVEREDDAVGPVAADAAPVGAVPFGDVIGLRLVAGAGELAAHVQLTLERLEGVHGKGGTRAEGGPVGAVPRGDVFGRPGVGPRERTADDELPVVDRHGLDFVLGEVSEDAPAGGGPRRAVPHRDVADRDTARGTEVAADDELAVIDTKGGDAFEDRAVGDAAAEVGPRGAVPRGNGVCRRGLDGCEHAADDQQLGLGPVAVGVPAGGGKDDPVGAGESEAGCFDPVRITLGAGRGDGQERCGGQCAGHHRRKGDRA